MIKRLLYTVSIIIIITAGAAGVIAYSRGYRFNIDKKTITTTGILSVSSFPEKASIWIDGKLISATNASITLQPGWYNVRVSQEGYLSWEKKVRLQGEIVSQVDALLIPNNPSLRVLTVSGVSSPVLSPNGTKAVFIIPPEAETGTSSAKLKYGLWLIEFKNNPLGGKSDPKLLFQPATTYNWKNTRLYWSPDEKQVILTFLKKDTRKETTQSAQLISTDNNQSTEITFNYLEQLKVWEEETKAKEKIQISTLNPVLADFFTRSTDHLRFSPDDNKILYQATASATLPQILNPAIIGSNSTEEIRKITPGTFYIYDFKEDKNFAVGDKKTISQPESVTWYTDSKHIIMIEKETIYIVDYDGTNKRAAYTGPFEDSVVYPWPGGNRLVILTSLNKPNTLPNFYEVDLR